jgi:8-oxo-dGTP pyrophosphatase MutT (NUDIX family)
MLITLDILRAALALAPFDALRAHRTMAPSGSRVPPEGVTPREAGVLILTYPEVDGLRFVLTRRTDTLRGHSGQISFPGGKRDPEDNSLAATALRETCEELAFGGAAVTLIGELSSIYIPPTNFIVTPFVGHTTTHPVFRPNPDEVAEVFSARLADLLAVDVKQMTYRDIPGGRMQVPHYALNGHVVWGATAIILSELEHRLRAVLGLAD